VPICYLDWVDITGGKKSTMVRTVLNTANILTQMSILSRAQMIGAVLGDRLPYADALPGLGLTYPDVADAAILTFQMSNLQLNRLAVPAPKSSLFLADGETVDATAATAIINACSVGLRTLDGAAVLRYISGKRIRRPAGAVYPR
jgi:hypothetical protein